MVVQTGRMVDRTDRADSWQNRPGWQNPYRGFAL